MSKILTAKQVASTRARASEYRTVRREIESLCDSHEALRLERDELAAGKDVALHHYGELHPSCKALRAGLKECVEAFEEAVADLEGGDKCMPKCDKATLAIASRLRQALTTAKEALGNG